MMNKIYIKSKSLIPGASPLVCFTVHIKAFFIQYLTVMKSFIVTRGFKCQ